MGRLGVAPHDTTAVHYRGEGWPGRFRMTLRGGQEASSLTYEESWSRLTSYRPMRCNLCPDGLGRLADLSCGDAWDRFGEAGDTGRSLILVRTERGRKYLHAAARAGYITLMPAGPARVIAAQDALLQRRRELFGRLAALKLVGAPIPSYKGFALARAWAACGPRRWVVTLGGTLRRVVQRSWFRRRPSYRVAADAS
jgi:coenzyme F420 hydrogenase subunit beta